MPILEILTEIRDSLQTLEALLTALTSVGTDQLDVNVKAIDVPVNADTVDTYHAAAAPAANVLLAMDAAGKFPAHTLAGLLTLETGLRLTGGQILLENKLYIRQKDTAGTAKDLLFMYSDDDVYLCSVAPAGGAFRLRNGAYARTRMMFVGGYGLCEMGIGNHITSDTDLTGAEFVVREGDVGINDLIPAEKLDVNGNVRADDYLEFSPTFTGDALAALRNIQALPGTGPWAHVDHTTLPDRVAHVVHERRWFNKHSDVEMPRHFGPPEVPPGVESPFELREYDRTCRSLPHNVQMIQRAVLQLLARVETLEAAP